MTMLEGRTALVTGGSRGIGRAVVHRLAAAGARVVFTYRRSEDSARRLAAELPGATAVRADPDSRHDMLAAVRDGLDILVNNAAVAPVAPIAELTEDDIAYVFAVNTTFPLLTIRDVGPVLRDGGRIVNISTLNTASPGPGLALYCASKAALEQITRVAAYEFGPRGVTVNTVSPGATETDLFRANNPPDVAGQLEKLTALGRIGQPDDIAAVVEFLAGPDSGWVTGQNIRVTGGLSI